MTTESENPYAPPEVEETFKPPQENYEDDLVFRSGSDVHIFRNAALPARCMMTGEETAASVLFATTWHPSWINWLILPGILPYLVVASAFRQKVNLLLPITESLLEKHDRIILGGLGLMLAAIVFFIMLMLMTPPALHRFSNFPIVLSVLCGLLGFLTASRWPVSVRIIYASNNLLVLRGAHRDYLRHLPDLPADTLRSDKRDV